MTTTYYLVQATGTIVRATTAQARTKLASLAARQNYNLKPLLPKEAKQLILEKREYYKIKDLL